MKFLAPIVITLLVSGGLYMNREIWSLANYNQSGTGAAAFGSGRYGGTQRGQESGYDQYRSLKDFGGEASFPKGGKGQTLSDPVDIRSESR